MAKEEKALIEITSRIVTLLPQVHTLIKNLEILVAGRAHERDIQTLKQRITTFLNTITTITQGEMREMLDAQRGGSAIDWSPFLALTKGQVAKIQEIQQKITLSLYPPHFTKEMENLFFELTKLYEEELVQLRKMSGEEKAA